MDISMSIPLDEGFLRRECPNCIREFKWFTEETAGRPEEAIDPEVYFCPYCGVSAPVNHWWTKAQLDYAQEYAMAPMSDYIEDELKDLERSSRSSLVSFKFKPGSRPPSPAPLEESNDMVIVEPPCHPYEPLKISEEWAEPIHCLVCGNPFRVEI